jgi:hypothetical protein
MPAFKDKQNREWELVVDVPMCRAVKALGVNILDLNSDPIAKLKGDPLLLADVLWKMCAAQAEEKTVSQDDFQGSLGGVEFDSAIEALKEAVIGFHPASKHAAIRAQFEHNDQVQNDGVDVAVDSLKLRRVEIQQAMRTAANNEFDRLLTDITHREPSNGRP